MDKQDYLNKISATSKPPSAKKQSFLKSFYFKLIAGLCAAILVVVIIGIIISNGRVDVKSQSIDLKLHLDGTMEMISEYQSDVKSSDLRSSSASLYGVLSNANSSLEKFLTEKHGIKIKSLDKKLLAKAEEEKEELNTELFSAKINGILDRIYAHKMAYEISIITSKEASIIRDVSDAELKEALTSSYNSLNNLYDKFNDFSETK
ncbi:hypothetical protein IKE19_00675 [Candidatus Saccharibacteria bacterium]|nr:hypothetical protein [Candidatus Saccharibacteria bacterium]